MLSEFPEYDYYPGWWMHMGMVIAKTKCTSKSEEEFQDFVEQIAEYLEQPLPAKGVAPRKHKGGNVW